MATITQNLGIDNLDFNFTGAISGVAQISLLIILMVLAGAIWGFFLYRKQQKKKYDQDLHFFEEVNIDMIPTHDYKAADLVVPRTNIRIFHIKENDLYLPRGTKLMGKKSYWYAIRNNREIVNFKLKNLNKDMQEAGLDYDHTDQRYAHTNLKNIIQRNYRDKSIKWWQQYKDIIATVIFIFVLTLCFIFIISKMGGLIDKIGALIDTSKELANQNQEILQQLNNLKTGSGVIQQ